MPGDMPGPKDIDVNKEHGGPAHNLAKHQNDSYALISLIIHQLPTPFWGSNPWPIIWASLKGPGCICLFMAVARFAGRWSCWTGGAGAGTGAGAGGRTRRSIQGSAASPVSLGELGGMIGDIVPKVQALQSLTKTA